MIRILQVVNNMHRAGLETILMNYYRSMDREQIQFDFLTHRPERSDYDDEIEAMGGRIYRAPRLYPQHYPAYFEYMKKFFREHPEYTIVHSHIDAMSYLPLLAAKKAGVPVRIAHSHSTLIDKDFKLPLKLLFRRMLPTVTTHFCTCGDKAGEFLFPKQQCHWVPNAIDAKRFLYDEKVREKKRNELGVQNNLVVGHVGRFSYPKNHVFLIEIFSELCKIEKDAKLILVGVGEKESEVRAKVENLNLVDKVLFLGKRSDVDEIYQALDVFVMPSLFEGVPVVGIEAQFTDLPCVFSNKVPTEVRFTDASQFVPLEKSAKDWAKVIADVLNTKKERMTQSEEQLQSAYNIEKAKIMLTEYYMDLNHF